MAWNYKIDQSLIPYGVANWLLIAGCIYGILALASGNPRPWEWEIYWRDVFVSCELGCMPVVVVATVVFKRRI